ncbi:MAG: NAD-dependent epimerase/dehydratase family protein [Candidatus Methylarchaceae archaeon HK01M]|nr:NAD-dependent epimerase/dehydratase family protein [Candidatus Methylarchaceae archaeon HK01M]
MRRLRILVTGSNGFIGKILCKKLKERGNYVIGFDIIPSSSNHTNMNLVGNILNLESLLDATKGVDTVFHLAAVANLNYAREHSIETVEINVTGTANVAEVCRKYDIPLCYASTCCVYGNTQTYPAHEEGLLRPTEIYGCTKLAGEYIIKGYHSLYGLKHNIMRYATTYGAGMRKELVVYIFLEKAIKGEALPIHGTGKQTRDFIYIDDLINAQIKLLESGVMNETFNFAGDEEISVLEITEICQELVDHKIPLVFVEDRPGQVMREKIDISKTCNLLGWKPQTSFKDGMKKTFEWIKTVVGK